MSLLRRLLLLPLLAPLLVVLVIGAVNPRPPVRLRLLIWSSPPLPIGVWLMLASGGGALLSAGATALALRGAEPGLQRQVVRELWPDREPEPKRTREPMSGPAWPPEPEPAAAAPPSAGPSRPPGEPVPTVAVAYRVIRRPASTAASPVAAQAQAAAPASRRAPDRSADRAVDRAADGGPGDGDGWDPGPGEEW
ncbi:MAG: hypothetical protein R6U00_10505 [Prochlorococcaceae cyanobacterium]